MKSILSSLSVRHFLKASTFAFLLVQAQGFGFQSWYFQSQATQGNQWFGYAPIQKEELTITVFPDYLDVQLDWEISARGYNPPAEFTDALEITGDVFLEPNSAVIGMLLWNGNKILKAKLKTKDQARKAYEEVVDRNVVIPPRPKDPVLMEWISNDRYAISIFPVELGGFRKLRLRYLVPSNAGTIGFPRPISQNAKVTMELGSGIKGFNLKSYSGESLFGPYTDRSVVLDRSKFALPNTSYPFYQVKEVIPIPEDSSDNSRIYIGNFFGNGISGTALNAVYRVPPKLLEDVDAASEDKPRIFATIMGKRDSCRKEINPLGSAKGVEVLKILAREDVGQTLKWSVFLNDELKKEVFEKPTIIRMEDGMQYARSFGNSKFYPLAESMPFSLGSALGFIDKTYALLALEEDVLPAITAEKYLVSGVPTLNPEDIFPSKEDTAITVNAWTTARGYNPNDLLQPTGLKPLRGLPAGISYSTRGGKIFIRLDRELLGKGDGLGISIFSFTGKQVRKWTPRELAGGELSWAPSEAGMSGGVYLVRVQSGAEMYSQAVILK